MKRKAAPVQADEMYRSAAQETWRAAGSTGPLRLGFGGWRDLLLGVENLDIDVTVEGDGIFFAERFAATHNCRVRCHHTFGTAVLIRPDGSKVDVASTRLEYYESPGVLPTVERSSLRHDLYRRDFTINTLALCINEARFGLLTDYFGGRQDIQKRTVRVLHNLSFVEDPTRVFRAIRSVLRGDPESEDAMQQAWLSAYSHLGQYRGTSSFSTWLTRIALNEALGRAGRRPRLTPIDEVPEEDEGMRSKTQDPEERAADRELGHMMEEAIDELPDLYRSVFVLRAVEGMSTADAALALGASEEAVKVRLHRARLALRDGLYARAGSASKDAFPFLGWRCDRMVANVLGRILGGPPAA